MGLFSNASPEVIHLGTDDKSIRVVTPERDPIPQHLPKLFIKARKGTTKPMLLAASKLFPTYGSETFDMDGPYYNHQTRFLTGIAGQANTCMVQRIVPDDAGIKSNITLYVDVIDKQIPNYVRNSLGEYVIDGSTNAYKVDAAKPTISGKEIKFITDHDTDTQIALGLKSSKKGTMTAEVDNDDVKLVIDADVVADFQHGITATGHDSSATGTVKQSTLVEGKTEIILGTVTGTFTVGEVVNNGTSDTEKGIESIDTDLKDTIYSTMFPILQFEAKFQGEYYNNLGFAIESLFLDDVNGDIVNDTLSMPYKLALYTRKHAGATPVVMRSLFGEPAVQMSFKEKAKNPMTEARFDIDAVFAQQWFNETDSLKPLVINDYEGMYVYRTNIELVANSIMQKEKQYVSEVATTWDDNNDAASISWMDFTTSDQTALDKEIYLINMFTCKTSKNKPYFTVVHNNETATLEVTEKEVSVAKNAPIFLNGGSDGDLSNAMYETVLSRVLEEYADADSQVQDTAINVESTIYDSGFRLDMKKDLANFIALRKDTTLALTTHDAELGEKDLPLSDVRAIAVALKARIKLAPESDYFGTSVARAVVVGGTGQMRDGSTLDRIPLTYEVALKTARMTGAGNFKWKAAYAFDHGTLAIMEWLVDITPAFIPAGIKPTLWNDGLVWAQPKDRMQYFFPAMQTVYSNDTSVLNTWTTVIAIGTLNKIGADAWREFTGTNTMSDGQFKDAVTAYCNDRLSGIFGGLLVVVPEVIISERDELRGYSWQLVFKLYAPNMKTKMVTWVEAHRISDLG